MNLTPWFPGKVRPVRDGWYEVKCRHGMFGSPAGERIYWHRGRWYLDDTDLRNTAWAWCSFGRSCDQWRGLAGAGTEGAKPQ